MGVAFVQGLETEFVDDKDPGREVLPSCGPPGRVLLVAPEPKEEVVGGKPRDGEAVLDSLDAQSRRKMAFAHPGRAQKKDVLFPPHVFAGRQKFDLLFTHAPLEGEFEVFQGLAVGSTTLLLI
jgi:hypothetical protein